MSDPRPSGLTFTAPTDRRLVLAVVGAAAGGLALAAAWAATQEAGLHAECLAVRAVLLGGAAVSALRVVTGRLVVDDDGVTLRDAVRTRRWAWDELTGVTVDTRQRGVLGLGWLARGLAGPFDGTLLNGSPAPLPDPFTQPGIVPEGHEPRVAVRTDLGEARLPTWLGWSAVTTLVDLAARRGAAVHHARAGATGRRPGAAVLRLPVVVARLDDDASRALGALFATVTRGEAYDRAAALGAAETLGALGLVAEARRLVDAVVAHPSTGDGASPEAAQAAALRLLALDDGATAALDDPSAAHAPGEAALLRAFGLRAAGLPVDAPPDDLDPLGRALLRALARPELSEDAVVAALESAPGEVPASRALVIGHGLGAIGLAPLATRWLEARADDAAEPATALALRRAAASHVSDPPARAHARLRVARLAVQALGSAHVLTLRARLDAHVAALVADAAGDSQLAVEAERHLGPHATLPDDVVDSPCTLATAERLDLLADAVTVAVSADLPWAEAAADAIVTVGTQAAAPVAARAAACVVVARLGPERAAGLAPSLVAMVLAESTEMSVDDAAFVNGAAAVLLAGRGDAHEALARLAASRLQDGGYAASAWGAVPALARRLHEDGHLPAVRALVDDLLAMRPAATTRRAAWRDTLRGLLGALPAGARRHRDALVEALAASGAPEDAPATSLLRAMERWRRGDPLGTLAHLDALVPGMDAILDGAPGDDTLSRDDLRLAVALRARALAAAGRADDLARWLDGDRSVALDAPDAPAVEIAAALALAALPDLTPPEIGAWLAVRADRLGLPRAAVAWTVGAVLAEAGHPETAEIVLRHGLDDGDDPDEPGARALLEELVAARRSRGGAEPDAPPLDDVTSARVEARPRRPQSGIADLAAHLAEASVRPASDETPDALDGPRVRLAALVRRAAAGGRLGLSEVVEVLDELAPPIDADAPGALDLAAAATVLVAVGGAAEAVVPWARAREEAARARHPEGHGTPARLAQVSCVLRTAAEPAEQVIDDWLALLDAGDAGAPFPPILAPPWLGAGEALLDAGRPDEAHDVLASGLEHPDARRSAGTPLRLALLRACLAADRLDEGLERADDALRAVRAAPAIAEAEVRAVRGELLAAVGRSDEAYAQVVEAAALRQAQALWLGVTPALSD